MGPARTGAGTQPLPVVPGLESPGVPEPREQVLPLAAPGPRSRATSPFRGHFPSRPAPRPPSAAAPPLLRCPSPSSAYLVPVRPFPVVRKRKPRPEQKPCLCPLACPSGTLSLPCLYLSVSPCLSPSVSLSEPLSGHSPSPRQACRSWPGHLALPVPGPTCHLPPGVLRPQRCLVPQLPWRLPGLSPKWDPGRSSQGQGRLRARQLQGTANPSDGFEIRPAQAGPPAPALRLGLRGD